MDWSPTVAVEGLYKEQQSHVPSKCEPLITAPTTPPRSMNLSKSLTPNQSPPTPKKQPTPLHSPRAPKGPPTLYVSFDENAKDQLTRVHVQAVNCKDLSPTWAPQSTPDTSVGHDTSTSGISPEVSSPPEVIVSSDCPTPTEKTAVPMMLRKASSALESPNKPTKSTLHVGTLSPSGKVALSALSPFYRTRSSVSRYSPRAFGSFTSSALFSFSDDSVDSMDELEALERRKLEGDEISSGLVSPALSRSFSFNHNELTPKIGPDEGPWVAGYSCTDYCFPTEKSVSVCPPTPDFTSARKQSCDEGEYVGNSPVRLRERVSHERFASPRKCSVTDDVDRFASPMKAFRDFTLNKRRRSKKGRRQSLQTGVPHSTDEDSDCVSRRKCSVTTVDKSAEFLSPRNCSVTQSMAEFASPLKNQAAQVKVPEVESALTHSDSESDDLIYSPVVSGEARAPTVKSSRLEPGNKVPLSRPPASPAIIRRRREPFAEPTSNWELTTVSTSRPESPTVPTTPKRTPKRQINFFDSDSDNGRPEALKSRRGKTGEPSGLRTPRARGSPYVSPNPFSARKDHSPLPVKRITPRREGSLRSSLLPVAAEFPHPPGDSSFVDPFCSTPLERRNSRESYASGETGTNSGSYYRDSIRDVEFARYQTDYTELQELGSGTHGRVVKVIKHLDGIVYAIKQSNSKIRGERDRENKLQEVYALANATNAPNIVQYFDSWIEDDTVFLRLEYCEGGTVENMKQDGEKWTSEELMELLLQVTRGLHHLHSHNMSHMDLKMENVYVKYTDTGKPIYQIGDLGLVRRIGSDPDGEGGEIFAGNDAEGDSRYVCKTLLNSDKYMKEADIFSLGASIYELARGKPLPLYGEEWQAIRNGCLEGIEDFPDLRQLLLSLMHPDPTNRPSTFELLKTISTQTAYGDAEKIRGYESEIFSLRQQNKRLEMTVSLQNSISQECIGRRWSSPDRGSSFVAVDRRPQQQELRRSEVLSVGSWLWMLLTIGLPLLLHTFLFLTRTQTITISFTGRNPV